MFENKGKALIYIILYRVLWHLWQQKHKNSCIVRVYARVREEDYTYFYNLVFPFFSISSHPLENHPSVYKKQAVVLWKMTRRFMENKPSFYEKRHVVLDKTTRRFE